MLLRPILQKKKKNPIDAVMVQQAKYYSKRINFTETNAWEMIEESKRVLQITIAYYLSPNLSEKRFLEKCHLGSRSNATVIYQNTQKMSHAAGQVTLLSGFNSSTKKRTSEKDTRTCTSWQSRAESWPQLPSPTAGIVSTTV